MTRLARLTAQSLRRLICVGAALILVGGCSQDVASPLVGEWQTAPTLSQLGQIVSYYQFRSDGTFNANVTFIDAKIPDMATRGTYKVTGNSLDLTTPEKTTSSTFMIENDMLTIREGPQKTFTFSRK